MKILYFGDIIGKPGRTAVRLATAKLKAEQDIDIVVANVENSAHGFGITPDIIAELEINGVDFFTSGNHVWKNSRGVSLLETNVENVLVPTNYEGNRPGLGYNIIEVNGVEVFFLNMVGQVFMDDDIESPFSYFDSLYEKYCKDRITIIDFHAEATGEKRALAWYIDGRASLLVGTHTHVPTADAHMMPAGLGYVTDLGMCGATESSLGMDKDLVIKKVAHSTAVNLEPPENPAEVIASGILAEIDTDTKKTISIERVDHKFAL